MTCTADNTAYTLRATPRPSGYCSLRSQRRICWKRYMPCHAYEVNDEQT